jgi:hypothetical protein
LLSTETWLYSIGILLHSTAVLAFKFEKLGLKYKNLSLSTGTQLLQHKTMVVLSKETLQYSARTYHLVTQNTYLRCTVQKLPVCRSASSGTVQGLYCVKQEPRGTSNTIQKPSNVVQTTLNRKQVMQATHKWNLVTHCTDISPAQHSSLCAET